MTTPVDTSDVKVEMYNPQERTGGDIVSYVLANGGDMSCLRPNTSLPRDAWIHFDNTVLQVSRDTLKIVQDFFSAGLVYNIPNPLGTITIEWSRSGDMTGAQIGIVPETRGQSDKMTFDQVRMPLPIVHKQFSLNAREMAAAINNGYPIDTTLAAVATRKVNEFTEDMFMNGTTVGFGADNGAIYGLSSHPDRHVMTAENDTPWITLLKDGTQRTTEPARPGTALSEGVGEVLVDQLTEAFQMLEDHNVEGPFVMYVPTEVMNYLGKDYKANSDKSILVRLLEMPNLQAIRATNRLRPIMNVPTNGSGTYQYRDLGMDGAATNTNFTYNGVGDKANAVGKGILICKMTQEHMDLVNGIQPSMYTYPTGNGGWSQEFMVLSMQLPRMKSNKQGQNGVLQLLA